MTFYEFPGNNGLISHLQIPGNMQGFNSQNETIDLPPVEIMPPVLKGIRDARGMLYYTVTGKRFLLRFTNPFSHPLGKNIPFYRCLRFFYPGLLSQPRLRKLSQSANHCLI